MESTTRGFQCLILGAALAMTTGCGLDLRLNKATVGAGGKTGVNARLSGVPDGARVDFQVIAGTECGKVAPAFINTADGVATVTFTGDPDVEDCKATIEARALGRRSSISLYVNKLPLAKVKIDGVSLLVLFLIASFAVDRIVRAVLFLLSFLPVWRKLVPETPGQPAEADKKQRLVYVLMAGVLAIVVLGWLGNVRMLAALGFAQVDPLIDTLFSGLLLVGGAERTEAILQKMGAGGVGAEGAKPSATPLEVTGRLVLEEAHKPEKPAAGAHSVAV